MSKLHPDLFRSVFYRGVISLSLVHELLATIYQIEKTFAQIELALGSTGSANLASARSMLSITDRTLCQIATEGKESVGRCQELCQYLNICGPNLVRELERLNVFLARNHLERYLIPL